MGLQTGLGVPPSLVQELSKLNGLEGVVGNVRELLSNVLGGELDENFGRGLRFLDQLNWR